MADRSADVLVIGGGPGGYTAAIRAAQLGHSVVLAERDALGGVCLNWGCIPTKSLLHAADVLHELGRASALGLDVTCHGFDLGALVARSRGVAYQLSQGVAHLMKKNRIEVLYGPASFNDSQHVRVGETRIRAARTIVATGAHARALPFAAPDARRIWDARTAMTPAFLPARLLVVGGGAIGCEFASFYNDIGSDVTLLEVQPELLPTEDAEVARHLAGAFAARGIDVVTGTSLASLEARGETVVAEIGEVDVTFDAAILCVGVAGNCDGLGLEQTGVRVDRGFIQTDGNGQTADRPIYAVGDVAGPPCLAHKASHAGVRAVEHLSGCELVPRLPAVPSCTYCRPQVASVGLSEASARSSRRDIRIGRFPLLANGKAAAIGDTDGFVKTVFDAATGELLGAHMIGPGVTELIQGYAVAISHEATEASLMHTMFPHPTLSESLHEAVLAAYDRSLNS